MIIGTDDDGVKVLKQVKRDEDTDESDGEEESKSWIRNPDDEELED